jgi:hypothetical protein
MTIRRLDVFFRTQLTLDTPSTSNTLTNLALAPLQHLIGQNQFQSLKGKVSEVPPTTAPPPFYAPLKKVIRVFAFFLALVLTPVGIATRYLSFRSPQIDRAYSHAFLLQLTPFDRTPELMESSFAFMRKMTETERNELLTDLPEDLTISFLSLPIHHEFTNAIFAQLPPVQLTKVLKKLPTNVQGAFLSLDANAEFSKNYVRELTESEYTQLMPHLSANLIELYLAQKAENAKKKSLDDALSNAIQSLERLENKLKANGDQDPSIAQFRSDPLYPFPFYFAQQIETHPKIVARADKALWERFLSLRKSCVAYLPPNRDEKLLETTKDQANATLKGTFQPNARFFKELQGKLESKMETPEIKEWIEGKRREHNYSYPFYTQPRVLKLMEQTASAEKLRPFSETLSSCSDLLWERGLQEYISEKPDPHHVAVNALMQAMDELENISKLQELIKTQTA